MDAKLVVVGGKALAAEYSLRLPTVIGRSRNADLPLPNPLVSRQHCELFETEGQLMVRDLGSLNGTYIGNARIQDASRLDPGSLLTIGAVTFQAVYKGPPRSPEDISEFLAEGETGSLKQTASIPLAGVQGASKQTVNDVPSSTHDNGSDSNWLDLASGDSGELTKEAETKPATPKDKSTPADKAPSNGKAAESPPGKPASSGANGDDDLDDFLRELLQ